MANENFSLSFTVADFAEWIDFSQGRPGPSTSILVEFLTPDYTGPTSSILGDFITGDAGPGEPIGPAINILGDLIAIDTTGPAINILGDLIAIDITGPAAIADTNGLCLPNSILSLPGQSTLSGPLVNIMSCT